MEIRIITHFVFWQENVVLILWKTDIIKDKKKIFQQTLKRAGTLHLLEPMIGRLSEASGAFVDKSNCQCSCSVRNESIESVSRFNVRPAKSIFRCSHVYMLM